ncbi:MAG: apolipoprotein N-acyltransferase [Planctomycetota bacterium]
MESTAKQSQSPADSAATPPRARVVLIGSLVSSVLLFLAFPPVGWWPLAWLAPAGWCAIVATRDLGSRPYRVIYLTAIAHWLAVIHWIRLPHWSAHFGWLVLAAYLAVYIPAFVCLARQAVHRFRIPIWVACPVVWMGLELIRGYMLTGFSMALLGHTQVEWTQIIQIADVGGAYLVGALIMLVGSSLANSWIRWRERENASLRDHAPLAVAATSVGLALFYGANAIPLPFDPQSSGTRTQVALIQGSRDTTFTAADDPAVTLDHYRTLTTNAVAQHPDVDLIVWPESMHTIVWCEAKPPLKVPADYGGDERMFAEQVNYMSDRGKYEAGWFARQFGKSALVGCSALEIDNQPLRRFNSALAISKSGNVTGKYNKMHPVMFGEYVPLGKTFPWLYRLTPMGSGLESGTEPVAVEADKLLLSPSICYENTVPHLIRRQVRQLIDRGTPPDALVTISNDGWFWGSSQLDLHLTCGVFRAVEMRRPMLIAANTGFSAWIDAAGRVRSRGPRREPGYVIAEIERHNQSQSLYLRFGDWMAAIAAACCVGLAWSGWRNARAPFSAAKSA